MSFGLEKKAKELGLIDGLGNAEQILREKYGDQIEIKKFEKVKGGCQKNYHPQKIILIK